MEEIPVVTIYVILVYVSGIGLSLVGSTLYELIENRKCERKCIKRYPFTFFEHLSIALTWTITYPYVLYILYHHKSKSNQKEH